MEYKQLEFDFIEKAKEQEKRSRLEAIVGGFACAVLSVSLLLGATYLKVAKPEVLDNTKAFLEKIYPMYTGPY